MGSRVLKVKRVVRGKARTALEDREYALSSSNEARGLAEWLEFAKALGCDRVEAREADGTTVCLEVRYGR